MARGGGPYFEWVPKRGLRHPRAGPSFDPAALTDQIVLRFERHGGISTRFHPPLFSRSSPGIFLALGAYLEYFYSRKGVHYAFTGCLLLFLLSPRVVVLVLTVAVTEIDMLVLDLF